VIRFFVIQRGSVLIHFLCLLKQLPLFIRIYVVLQQSDLTKNKSVRPLVYLVYLMYLCKNLHQQIRFLLTVTNNNIIIILIHRTSTSNSESFWFLASRCSLPYCSVYKIYSAVARRGIAGEMLQMMGPKGRLRVVLLLQREEGEVGSCLRSGLGGISFQLSKWKSYRFVEKLSDF